MNKKNSIAVRLIAADCAKVSAEALPLPLRERDGGSQRSLSKFFFGIMISVLSSCATVPRDAGFQEVQSTVSERIGQRVQWRTGSPEDQEVAAKVSELLRQELDAERAVQIALLNNSRLQATYEELAISQADLVQAGLLRNPVFDAAILFPEGDERPELDFGISQDFLSIFYLPLNKRLAENQFEAAKLRVTGEVLGLAREVRSAFYRAQAANQMLDLFDEVVRNTSASYVAAQKLYEAGNITDLALAQERSIYEESRLALAQAEADFLFARERLNRLMGVWGEQTQWKINARLPALRDDALDLDNLEARAIEASFDLAAQRNALVASATRLGLIGVIPDLEIGVRAEREEDWEFGPTIGLEIPIFDFGQARRAQARAELRRAQAQYAASAVELRAAVRAAYATLVSTRDRAIFVRDVFLPLRNQVVNQTLLQYNAMQVGVFQLLIAQRDQIAAARQYIETLRDYWMARSDLQQTLVGGTRSIGHEAGK